MPSAQHTHTRTHTFQARGRFEENLLHVVVHSFFSFFLCFSWLLPPAGGPRPITCLGLISSHPAFCILVCQPTLWQLPCSHKALQRTLRRLLQSENTSEETASSNLQGSSRSGSFWFFFQSARNQVGGNEIRPCRRSAHVTFELLQRRSSRTVPPDRQISVATTSLIDCEP